MHRVGVLGSCVTRDALTPLSDNVQISWYQARTSIPSMGSPPAFVSLSFEDSSLPAFEQRNAFFDLYKSWRANIMRDDYEYLLIDFIDERFGCLLRGGAYTTWSTSYRAGKIHGEDGKTFPYISALSPQYLSAVESNIQAVIDGLKSCGKPIICADVCWTFPPPPHPVLELFPEDRYSKMNDVLRRIYDRLDGVPEITMLGLRDTALTLDLHHRWAVAPFHYDKTSTGLIAERIQAALATGEDEVPESAR